MNTAERGAILIVDDEPVVRESLEQWFADEGYRIVVAPGGKEALHLHAFQPEPAPTALDAATNRLGGRVVFDGTEATVKSLSRARTTSAGGTTAGGRVFYCFTAEAGATVFLVRWDEAGIEFYRGQASPLAEVTGPFRPGGGL